MRELLDKTIGDVTYHRREDILHCDNCGEEHETGYLTQEDHWEVKLSTTAQEWILQHRHCKEKEPD